MLSSVRGGLRVGGLAGSAVDGNGANAGVRTREMDQRRGKEKSEKGGSTSLDVEKDVYPDSVNSIISYLEVHT
jgi:hypothetical protein